MRIATALQYENVSERSNTGFSRCFLYRPAKNQIWLSGIADVHKLKECRGKSNWRNKTHCSETEGKIRYSSDDRSLTNSHFEWCNGSLMLSALWSRKVMIQINRDWEKTCKSKAYLEAEVIPKIHCFGWLWLNSVSKWNWDETGLRIQKRSDQARHIASTRSWLTQDILKLGIRNSKSQIIRALTTIESYINNVFYTC